MKVLIIGLGSIAQKHIFSILKIKPAAEIWALRSGISANNYENVNNIYSIDDAPHNLDFILICNPTNKHYQTVLDVLDLGKPLFIEKPSFFTMEESNKISEIIELKGIKTYVAFNFRFHPVIDWLKNNISKYKVLEVNAYCGSYLPDWRPGRNYSEIYSSKKEMGGGVNLDLIHELDYILWIFGIPKKSTGFISKNSELEINSPDYAHYLLEYIGLNISITLNYYRRDPKRFIEIVTDKLTLNADLIEGVIKDSKNEVLFSYSNPVLETYTSQMKYFLDNLNNSNLYMNDVKESSVTLSYALNNYSTKC